MPSIDKKSSREKVQKPKDKAASLILTALTVSGLGATIKNAHDTYQSKELLDSAKASLVENHSNVADYKKDHAAEHKAATKAMLQKASDQLKKGNKNFSEPMPEEVPASYGESETIIKQQIAENNVAVGMGAIKTIASAGFAGAMATLNKLKKDKKGRKKR